MQSVIRRAHRLDWFAFVVGEYSICNLGHFAVMAILSLFLITSLHLAAIEAGGILLFASLSFRLSRVFIAPLANRLPVKQATYLALFLTSLGYLCMSFAHTAVIVMALLLMVGIGHGTNSLLVKTMTANAKNRAGAYDTSLFLRYSLLTTGINLAAAVGALIGSALLLHSSASSVFILASVMYALAGCVALRLPSQEQEQVRQTNWSVELRRSLRVPALWRAMLVAALGWFLYTQSYASLPLFVTQGVHRADLLGTMFALNAVLVVIGQLPISRATARLRLPIAECATLAFLIFAAGFALLWLIPIWQMIYAAVALWTLAEILLMPALDTLVAEGSLPEYKRMAFTLNSVAVSIGEGLGNLVGVSLASLLLKTGEINGLYALLSLCALLALGMTIVTSNRHEALVFRLLRGQALLPTEQEDTQS